MHCMTFSMSVPYLFCYGKTFKHSTTRPPPRIVGAKENILEMKKRSCKWSVLQWASMIIQRQHDYLAQCFQIGLSISWIFVQKRIHIQMRCLLLFNLSIWTRNISNLGPCFNLEHIFHPYTVEKKKSA